MKKKLDWTKLPESLSYLALPAEKYGHYQFDDKIYEFLDQARTSEKKELKMLLQRMTKDEDDISGWLDKYNMTKHPEAQLVYFLLHLLALGNDAGLL